MPRNGSGVYSLPVGYYAVPGTTIRAAQHNAPLEDLAASMTGSLPRDGTAPMLGDLAMNSNKVTGLAAGVAGTDAARMDQVQTASPKLTALGAMDATPGIVTQTGAAAFTKRTLTGTANQITVTNGDGTAGNPTIALDVSTDADFTVDPNKPTTRAAIKTLVDAAAGVNFEEITVSGTWNRPAGFAADTPVKIITHAGGGGGTNNGANKGGGGGGGCVVWEGKYSDLPASASVTIGAGGAGLLSSGTAGAGGNTTFGSLVTSYGGAGAVNGIGGAGGGLFSAAAGSVPSYGGGVTVASTAGAGAALPMGGGGGGSTTGNNGGPAVFGGGGGAGTGGAGGLSLHGGAGGAPGVAGSFPGGGGGSGAAGAAGRVQVWIG